MQEAGGGRQETGIFIAALRLRVHGKYGDIANVPFISHMISRVIPQNLVFTVCTFAYFLSSYQSILKPRWPPC
jgi:hypothetical protein